MVKFTGVRRPFSLTPGSTALPRQPGARRTTAGTPVPRGVRCLSMGVTRLKRRAGGMRRSARSTPVLARVSSHRYSPTDCTILNTHFSPSPSCLPISNLRSLPSPLRRNLRNPTRQSVTGPRIAGPHCTAAASRHYPRRRLLQRKPTRPYHTRTRITAGSTMVGYSSYVNRRL